MVAKIRISHFATKNIQIKRQTRPVPAKVLEIASNPIKRNQSVKVSLREKLRCRVDLKILTKSKNKKDKRCVKTSGIKNIKIAVEKQLIKNESVYAFKRHIDELVERMAQIKAEDVLHFLFVERCDVYETNCSDNGVIPIENYRSLYCKVAVLKDLFENHNNFVRILICVRAFIGGSEKKNVFLMNKAITLHTQKNLLWS